MSNGLMELFGFIGLLELLRLLSCLGYLGVWKKCCGLLVASLQGSRRKDKGQRLEDGFKGTRRKVGGLRQNIEES